MFSPFLVNGLIYAQPMSTVNRFPLSHPISAHVLDFLFTCHFLVGRRLMSHRHCFKHTVFEIIALISYFHFTLTSTKQKINGKTAR